MNSLADQTSVQSSCAVRWCGGHLPTDDGRVVHVSRESVVVPTAGGTAERQPLYVALEQVDSGVTAIRVNEADPMLPHEALQFAAAVTAWAFTALLDTQAVTQ